jgi:hypothetical protein
MVAAMVGAMAAAMVDFGNENDGDGFVGNNGDNNFSIIVSMGAEMISRLISAIVQTISSLVTIALTRVMIREMEAHGHLGLRDQIWATMTSMIACVRKKTTAGLSENVRTKRSVSAQRRRRSSAAASRSRCSSAGSRVSAESWPRIPITSRPRRRPRS